MAEKSPLHHLTAYLYDNNFNNPTGEKIAHIVSDRSLTISDIAHMATTRGGSTVNEVIMVQAVNDFLREMARALCDGYNINTGWFHAHPELRGTFNSSDDSLDPDRHHISIDFRQGTKMQEMLQLVSVKIDKGNYRTPLISSITNMLTNTTDQPFNVGTAAQIAGRDIKIEGDDPTAGLYLLNTETGEQTQVEARRIPLNKPTQIMFLVPQLPAGTYTPVIITTYRRNRHAASLRTITTDITFTIE